jgi:hypothetical protein
MPPIPLAGPPAGDLDELDGALQGAPVGEGARLREQFGHWAESQTVFNAAREDFAGDAPGAPSETDVQRQVDSETANERYGVPGYLRFNAPVTEYDAAFQQHMALERQFRDQVLASSKPNALTDFGANIAGAITDPINVGLAALTAGSGDAALGAFGLGEATDAASAVTRVGRIANLLTSASPRTLAAGAIENAPFVGANAYLSNLAGDDYDFGDGLRDLAAGAVLHLGGKVLGEAARGLNPDGLRAPASVEEAQAQLATLRGEAPIGLQAPENGPGVDFMREGPSPDFRATSALTPSAPEMVEALPPAARYSAWAIALDRTISDEPVRVGELIERAQDVGRLDEVNALSDLDSFRPGEAATAVTTRGTEVPVRYGLAELGDLVTSHTDDMQVNPAYPAELQPRDRGRAGAYARNLQLEAELNPKLLMRDVGAGQGAPITSPSGVVESGNGRTIALRRAAAKGSDAYGRYRAELEAAGYDTTGMREPVLIRMRSDALTGAERASLAREMNADVTERMSPTEQAMADAKQMPGELFDQIEEGRGPTSSRAFARAFIDKVAPDQVGQMTDAEGRLSPEGARRIRAAVLARAYGDPRLVGQIFEGEESPARRFGEAMADAAPAWAKMRALAERGEIPRVLDLTPALTSAMDLVRFAAREKLKLGDVLGELLGQGELFDPNGAVSPFTEAFLRLFYRDETFARPLAAEKISAALKDYAERAGKIEPGEDLLGETPNEDTARAILALAADRFRTGDAGEVDTLRPAGPSRPGAEPREPPLLDLRPAGEPGERPAAGERVSPEGGEEPSEPERAARATGDQLIAADPELKAIADDTERLAAENALEPRPDPTEDPNTIAEAMRAASLCLLEEA